MAGKGVVALTGATGFVGGATLNLLIEAGWQVRALTRRSQPARSGVDWVEGALDQPESLAQLCEGADAILHIAGVVNAPDAAGFEAGNVTGTAHLLSAARESGISRFVHVSSLSAREPQLSVYGSSKAKGEKLVAMRAAGGSARLSELHQRVDLCLQFLATRRYDFRIKPSIRGEGNPDGVEPSIGSRLCLTIQLL